MRHPTIKVLLSLMSLSTMTAHAQFNTISPKNDSLLQSIDPFQYMETAMDTANTRRNLYSQFPVAKLGRIFSTQAKARQKQLERKKENYKENPEKVVKTPDFPLFDMSDSLLLSLIKKRLSVCMPLDWVYLTSDYGYRKDPFLQCKKFHDGIDLRCNRHLIYSMLQGRVEKVVYGSTGYGNHIVTTHGHLRFLYGHLSEIYVKEGEYIDAGKVIALSGQSGKSCGPHLHLAMSRLSEGKWKSVNPKPFIVALNDYIGSLDSELKNICGGPSSVPIYNNVELTKESLYEALKRHGVKFPKIVLAQAILETGHFTSRVCRDKLNLFGLRDPKTGEYYAFEDWESSILGYRDWVQNKYKGKPTNEFQYYSFLKNIGYASAKDYIYKVRRIAESL